MHLFAIPLLTLFFLSGCTKPVEKPEQVRPAMIYTVTQNSSSQASVYSGEVHARREAELGFRIGGKVTSRGVELGSEVKPGQVLAQLDPQDAQLATASARAQLAGAESEVANAAAELDRAQKLVKQQFLSQAALDARINADKTARARLAASRAQLNISGNQLSYTTLKADTAGVVTSVNFETGQVVSAGQPLVRIAYAGEKEVYIRVGEAQTQQFKAGSKVQVRLWAATQKAYTGVVREIAPAADENRTYLLKITINQADEAVRLGMTATVAFVNLADSFSTVALPAGALFQVGKQTKVWVVNAQQQVSAVPVQVVQYRENGLLVRGQLPAGTQVIAAGAHKLQPGQKIRPVPYDGPVLHAAEGNA
ncbi:efflux RND transporter periplasmic adaptor subunit [Sulfurirhabdus autotrophica]|uniref:RND family efflux transporter MFP subunit n=1 Tax=Sulfurirhabdus autotrophica TaxID=1706046 RepID=A0A4R3Y854_9PROT|nr:efflux RND transporter periplasmic adaptor subunit [Sulfurirhabdus autotrophica]TCV88046.1 RND family efflux transporter MFP subunit [Sulfurirhabdus autotrophica]